MISKRKKIVFIYFSLVIILLGGCEHKRHSNAKEKYIYYLNRDVSGFEKVPVKITGKNKLVKIEKLINN